MLLFFAGCASYVVPDDKKGAEQDVIVGTGVIGPGGVEGPVYAIIGDNGREFDPINLPEDFKQHGVKVKFKLKKSSGMSFHMWGEGVEVIEIRKIE